MEVVDDLVEALLSANRYYYLLHRLCNGSGVICKHNDKGEVILKITPTKVKMKSWLMTMNEK